MFALGLEFVVALLELLDSIHVLGSLSVKLAFDFSSVRGRRGGIVTILKTRDSVTFFFSFEDFSVYIVVVVNFCHHYT